MKKKSVTISALAILTVAFAGCSSSIGSASTVDNNSSEEQSSKAQTTTVPEVTTTTTTTTTEAPISLPEISEASVWAGDIVITGSGENIRAIMPYYGQYEYGEQYAEVINKAVEIVGDGVKVYNMCLPTSAGFYIPEDCKDIFSSQEDNIKHINESFVDVTGVDCWSALARHTDEYIYSRTDHHWEPLGAYYAAQEFCKVADVDFAELDEFTEKSKTGFLGSMYYYSNYYEPLSQYPDVFTYYLPSCEYTTKYYDTTFTTSYEDSLIQEGYEGENCYMMFQGGDEKITEIETNSTSERVLVIFKDSYGNALSPYLLAGFSKIYVCDFRYFKIDFAQFIEDTGCTDLLFAISISACQTPSHTETISTLLS